MAIVRDMKKAGKKLGRKYTTRILTRAAAHYLIKKRYSCHIELGVQAWGARRVDIMALNTKGHVIGCEVKSCPADYKSDTKWREYLPYVNQMYMIFSQKMWENEKFMLKVRPELKAEGVGIMVLSELSGYVQVRSPAKKRKIDPEIAYAMLLRMAWRGGKSRRTVKRRKRLYLS